jgi:Zn-dependent protease
MSWSWSIGRMFGIRIKIHVTFVLFVGWIAMSQGILAGDPARAMLSVALMLLVFTCVLLHELGHALTARRFGIGTHDIILLPIGGVARLERMPERPFQEVVVALAGPAVNVAIALLLAGIMAAFRLSMTELSVTGSLMESLLYINAVIVVFNLIPAFPMDGGRVLRAVLAMRMPFERATRIASYVGQAIAVVFGITGFATGQTMLLFVAMFVFLAASEERAMVRRRGSAQPLPVTAAMITEFDALDADEPVGAALGRVGEFGPHEYPVVHDGVPVGIVSGSELAEAAREGGPDRRVGAIMRPDQSYADAAESLDAVVRRMEAAQRFAVPVMQRGRLVGLVTLESVRNLVLRLDAMKRLQGAS